MNNIAIIPARIGSKGLTYKNIRLLGGKPLIYYTIIAAIESKLFDKIVVTSDSDKILKKVLMFDVIPHKRPSELGGDSITLVPVVKEAVEWAEMQYNEHYSHVFTLQPTSPFRDALDLIRAHKTYLNRMYDSLISVKEELHSIWKYSGNYGVPLFIPKVNRQVVRPNYVGNGAIFISKRCLIDEGKRLGRHIALFVMDEEHSIDIHTIDDLEYAEWILFRKKSV